MKLSVFAASLMAGSAAAFTPSLSGNGRVSRSSLNAEASKSMPFMNRPPLVSLLVKKDFRACWK